MQLIVGLGNPGPEYEMTRHNIGFLAIDELARRFQGHFKSEQKALTSKIRVGAQPALLVKPQTFMNLSGQAVRGLIDYYSIEQDQIIVVHDEVEFPFASMKFQKNRGHGGHNGIRNIHEHLGGNKYFRLRLGVSRPSHPNHNISDYVLQRFSKVETEELPHFIDRAADSLEDYLKVGFEKVANTYNQQGKN